MARTISTAWPTETIARIPGRLKAQGCGLMSVVDQGSLLGIVADRDIVIRCLGEGRVDP